MHLYMECINKKITTTIMGSLFSVLFLSGCEDAPQEVPPVSPPPTQAHTHNAPCYIAPKIPVNIQYGSYPYWGENLAEDNIKHYQSNLSEIEKSQNKTLVYYSLAVIIQTDKVTQMVSKETFAPQEAQIEVDALNLLIVQAQECYKAAPLVNNENLIRYNFLIDSAEQNSRIVEERIQRLRDNVSYTEGEKAQIGGVTEWMVKGSPGKVIRAYNNVVRDFNGLN